MKKKLLLVAGVGVAAFAASFASAASLGGVTPDTLGANSAAVSSCDADGITVDWTSVYVDATTDGYMLDKVDLGGIAAACAGKAYSVTLTGTAGAVLGTVTGSLAAVASPTEAVEFSNDKLAENVLGVHVVFSG